MTPTATRARAVVKILVNEAPAGRSGLPPRERTLRDQRQASPEQQQGNVDAQDRQRAERL
jgi:hypothetical protein